MADDDLLAYTKNIARDIQSLKSMMSQVIVYMTEAEAEVTEKMRRFIMYMHDLHDVAHIYEERGIPVPPHVMRELERVDDRFRHLVEDSNEAGGTFEKVRREMTKREGNRWDHSLMLPKEKVNGEASGTKLQNRTGGPAPDDKAAQG